MPTYGVTGYRTQSVTSTVYVRHLAVDIVDRASLDRGSPVKLYEGRLIFRGGCGSLASVFDQLAEALFTDWPGENGKTQTRTVSMTGGC